jgi:hypothetical protein
MGTSPFVAHGPKISAQRTEVHNLIRIYAIPWHVTVEGVNDDLIWLVWTQRLGFLHCGVEMVSIW